MAEVVLVGAGHAHLHVISQARWFRDRGHFLTVIDPGEFWYSGMAAGVLGGQYAPEDDRVDVAEFAARHDVEWIPERATTVDRGGRKVRLANGSTRGYDILSLNVGSAVEAPFSVAGSALVWPAKPVSTLWRLRRRLESFWARIDAPGQTVAICVIGGGATGVEIAANLKALGERHGMETEVVLVSADERLLMDAPRGAANLAHRFLETRGVVVHLNRKVMEVSSDAVIAEDGWCWPTDHVVLATGLGVQPFVRRLGLPFDPARGLTVNTCFQSVGDPAVFAAGDCADIKGHMLPKIGVFGVKGAPILSANLLAAADGETLMSYEPQSRYLSIINLGDGPALALWGAVWWQGRSMMLWKNRLDGRFMDLYRPPTTVRD